ncbi:PilZ domain-containing protein [Thiospirochaeta perfilievii]|uniref:PilZ domain-containing protein n=1 Tax=Thiospirochaeta perfilievii TaxID=252967 RepID=A0A5C1QDT9_9SPIO|nr:PilZ domain-containing protein [Thiospirochaeta perfilievii]QEN05751.1 PilZ domain-containing protein [Thiospirochaeta perfilievii]
MIYNIPLLQSKLRFSGNLLGAKKETDPKTMLITIGALVLFVILALVFNKIFSSSGNFRQYKRTFKKKAKELQLNKNQIKLLSRLLIESDIKKPLMVLTHPANLNTLLRKAIRNIKKESTSDTVKQNRIIEIYRIKHHLDKYQKSSQVKTTHELSIGTKVVIERNDKKSYTSSVIGNYENYFCIKLPIDSVGNQIKWKKGSMVKIIAFDRNDKESHFMSKTLGIKNVGSSNAIIISHTIRSSHSIARGFQRVDVAISTYVYPVNKTFDPGKKRYSYKINKSLGRVGKVIDISSGGCALTMKTPFPEGSIIQLDFDIDENKSVRLQGKILKLRIARGRKITHVKFTRANAKNLNLINNFIYSLG